MEDKIREELVFILINSVIICSVRNKYLFFFFVSKLNSTLKTDLSRDCSSF